MGRSKAVLQELLAARAPSVLRGRDDWWAAHQTMQGETPIVQAFLAGARCDRLAYAFASGYQCALRAMFGVNEIASLAITEARGAHPRDIETTYVDGQVTGVKTFATLAPWASRAFVLARGPEALVMTSVTDLHVEPLPPTPFASEIPHGVLHLSATPAVALAGDGYSRYTKPFRTVEDIYVHAAAVGFAMTAGFSREERQSLLMFAASLACLADEDPLGKATHLALAALLPQIRTALARFEKDAPLFMVAERIRAKRTEAAWA